MIPTYLNFTYSFTQVNQGATVDVTWNSDCPDALMRVALIRYSPPPSQVVQDYLNEPNSGSYMFAINSTLEPGEYGFYLQDMGANIWTYGSHFQLIDPLPIELAHFSGSFHNNLIDLDWTTANELNNDGFEIQKSINGKEWRKIGFIQGQGKTNEMNEYQYQDSNPVSGNNYYRLKQIDFDGAFEYSNIVDVKFTNSDKNIQVYPNPSNRNIIIKVDNPFNQIVKVKIFDKIGRKVWESKLIEGESNWREEIKIEENGIYLITAQVGNEMYTDRVVIMNEK